MTSPDAGATASPIAALLRRALIALGVSAVLVVLGMMLSGDRASAAEPEEAPRPVADLIAPVGSLLEDRLSDVAVLDDAPLLDDALQAVDALVAPVDQLAAPILTPVLDTVGTVLPVDVAVPSTAPLTALGSATLAEPAPTAPSTRPAPEASAVEASTTASAPSAGAPAGTPGSPSTDAVLTASAPGGSAVPGVSPTTSASAPSLADSVRLPLGDAPSAPVVDSDSTPD